MIAEREKAMTTPRKHRHADLIRRWLDDASLEIEMLSGGSWVQIGVPYWDEDREYRFKPRMIKVGGHEFPEPMKVAPKDGEQYQHARALIALTEIKE